MARIDRLKEEVSEIRSKMFYILGIIMMLFAGLGSLYLKYVDGNRSSLITIGVFIILILLQLFSIMYHMYKKNYQAKLDELGKE